MCFISERKNVLICMWDVQMQVSSDLPMPPNIHFFKHSANIYQLKINTQMKVGHIFLTWNLHIPHTSLASIIQKHGNQIYFYERLWKQTCFISVCNIQNFSSWNPWRSGIYFKDIRSLICFWSILVLLFLIKDVILILMLASSDPEFEIWTRKMLHCLGDL